MRVFKHDLVLLSAGGKKWLSLAGLSAASLFSASAALADTTPDFGPNVYIFGPSTPLATIQTTVNTISSQQIGNQFGTQRDAILFLPGTYGASTGPLNFQVGYYTSVAGLGLQPTDVVIDGSVDVYNQCASGSCVALDNFWRSLSNLSIKVDNASAGCYAGEFWAVSQAAPIRHVSVIGNTTLMDYCTGPSFASGGFIADSAFSGNFVNGSQQQWFTRNSMLATPTSWSNGVWNQVFSGVVNAPAQCFPATTTCGPYTTVANSPVTREAPYLYVDAKGNYNVLVPAAQTNSSGTSWSSTTATKGVSIPIRDFFIAKPSDNADRINRELAAGRNLILTPGVYALKRSLNITHADTIVLGLGFPTLVPQEGKAAIEVDADRGVQITGVIVDAGPIDSPVLVNLGAEGGAGGSKSDPSALHDVFFRIGGATAGSAKKALVVNSRGSILDDVWAWRADHGAGVGWTANTADTGLVVNGDDVIAYGLAVEHFQKYEVLWNGNNGVDIFFQNEMPYDPPSQAAWMEAPGVDGYAAFKVADGVRKFTGYGMGSYSFFNQGVSIFAANAFEVPSKLPKASLNDLLTVFLNATASGGISNVINNTGGSSTAANPDTPVTVTSYP